MGPVVVRRGLRCQAVGEAAVVVQVEGAWLRCPGASGPPGDASVLDSPAAHNKANGTELWAGAVYSTWCHTLCGAIYRYTVRGHTVSYLAVGWSSVFYLGATRYVEPCTNILFGDIQLVT